MSQSCHNRGKRVFYFHWAAICGRSAYMHVWEWKLVRVVLRPRYTTSPYRSCMYEREVLGLRWSISICVIGWSCIGRACYVCLHKSLRGAAAHWHAAWLIMHMSICMFMACIALQQQICRCMWVPETSLTDSRQLRYGQCRRLWNNAQVTGGRAEGL